jgi:hypothetical protein
MLLDEHAVVPNVNNALALLTLTHSTSLAPVYYLQHRISQLVSFITTDPMFAAVETAPATQDDAAVLELMRQYNGCLAEQGLAEAAQDTLASAEAAAWYVQEAFDRFVWKWLKVAATFDRCGKLLHCELHKRVTVHVHEQLQGEQLQQALELWMHSVARLIKIREAGATDIAAYVVFKHTDVAAVVASDCSIDSSIDTCMLAHIVSTVTLPCTVKCWRVQISLTLNLICDLLRLLTLTASDTSTNSSSGGANSTTAAAAAAAEGSGHGGVKTNTAQEPHLQQITMCSRCVRCHTYCCTHIHRIRCTLQLTDAITLLMACTGLINS